MGANTSTWSAPMGPGAPPRRPLTDEERRMRAEGMRYFHAHHAGEVEEIRQDMQEPGAVFQRHKAPSRIPTEPQYMPQAVRKQVRRNLNAPAADRGQAYDHWHKLESKVAARAAAAQMYEADHAAGECAAAEVRLARLRLAKTKARQAHHMHPNDPTLKRRHEAARGEYHEHRENIGW